MIVRFGRIFFLFSLSVLVFALSFYLFFPLHEAVRLAWGRGVLSASERGFFLDSAELSVEGRFPPAIVIRNIRLSSPLLSGEAGRAKIVLSPADTVIHGVPVACIRLERVSVNFSLPGQSPLYLASAEARGVFRLGRVDILDLQTEGDLNISGNAVVSPSKMSFEEGNVTIRGERSGLLEFFRSMLPLNRNDSGSWTLKKGGRQGYDAN